MKRATSCEAAHLLSLFSNFYCVVALITNLSGRADEPRIA